MPSSTALSILLYIRIIDELFSALPVIEEEFNFFRDSAVCYGSSLRSFRRVRFSAERKQICRVWKSELDGQMTIRCDTAPVTMKKAHILVPRTSFEWLFETLHIHICVRALGVAIVTNFLQI